ncbi:hypothetical protein QFZ67_000477 [Streptomyces sp. V1I1]|nr:hypothetical protein [Streptomyces sp. V1I1]
MKVRAIRADTQAIVNLAIALRELQDTARAEEAAVDWSVKASCWIGAGSRCRTTVLR